MEENGVARGTRSVGSSSNGASRENNAYDTTSQMF